MQFEAKFMINYRYTLVTCPDDFVRFQNRCYKFSTERKSWADARAACQAISQEYDLVTIDSQDLATYLVQKPDSWIGLSDSETEGTYKWVSGNGLGSFATTLGELPWGSGEPNVR